MSAIYCNETFGAFVMVRHLPPREKWFLIPTLAGCGTKLNSDSGPHHPIAQSCDLRNDLMHVDYKKLHGQLPKPGTAERHVVMTRAAADGAG